MTFLDSLFDWLEDDQDDGEGKDQINMVPAAASIVRDIANPSPYFTLNATDVKDYVASAALVFSLTEEGMHAIGNFRYSDREEPIYKNQRRVATSIGDTDRVRMLIGRDESVKMTLLDWGDTEIVLSHVEFKSVLGPGNFMTGFFQTSGNGSGLVSMCFDRMKFERKAWQHGVRTLRS